MGFMNYCDEIKRLIILLKTKNERFLGKKNFKILLGYRLSWFNRIQCDENRCEHMSIITNLQ
jgi:hypothetical protein